MENRQISQPGRRSKTVSSLLFFVLLIGGIVLCVSSFFLDGTVIEWVRVHENIPLKEFARFLSACGDWPGLMVSGGIGLAIALLLRKRELANLIVCMMISSTIAGALVNTVRLTSGRARPNNTRAVHEWNGLWQDHQFLLFNNNYHSFPSGHAGAASAFFAVPVFARRTYGRWTFLIALAIAWSRVYLNVHHLSDVLFGILVGTVTAYIVWKKIGSPPNKRTEARISDS